MRRGSFARTRMCHCDADLPWRPGGMTHDIGRGLKQEVVDGVSWIDVPDGPGLGIDLVEENVGSQRVARRW